MPRLRPDPSGRRRPSTDALVAVGVVVLAVLPVVVATVRAVARGWVPLSDDAFFSIRATDVFSRQIPLLGTGTSASLNAKQLLNHPGPLQFDLLAVPVRLFGGTAGVAIGEGLINVVVIVVLAWVAWRRGGLRLVVAAALVTGLLTWTMGSELLFDPWPPHALVLPFLCFLFLAWGLADGDLVLLPVAVGIGTLLVQTHVSYAYLVPTVGLVGVVGLAWRLRVRVKAGDDTGAAVRRRLAVIGAISALVLVVTWIQPVIDQVARDGNIGHLLDASDDAASPTLGATSAARVMASVVSLPPFWFRSSFSDTLAPIGSRTGGPGGVGLAKLPSLPLALASLVGLGAVLLACGVFARRRHSTAGVAAVAIALAGLAMAYFTSTRIPIEVFGVAEHNFRWLWSLGAFSLFAVLAALLSPRVEVREAGDDDAEARHAPSRPLVGVGVGLVAVVTLLNLPGYNAGVGPALNLWAEPVVRDLDHQIAQHPPRGPLLADFSNAFFLEPYSTALLAQLQRSGVKFVTKDESQVRQLGPARRYDGRNARARLAYRQGTAATVTPPGWKRFAFHAGLDPVERRELDRLQASGRKSARRTDLERDWDRATIGVFTAPLGGPSARETP